MKRKRTPSQWGNEQGAKLRALRQTRGDWLSTYRLAELTDYSDSLISLVETGKQRPTPKFLYAIAPHLGVRPDNLLLLAGYIDEEGRWDGTPEARTPLDDVFEEARALLARGAALVEYAAQRRAQAETDAAARLVVHVEAAVEFVKQQRSAIIGETELSQMKREDVLLDRLASRILRPP